VRQLSDWKDEVEEIVYPGKISVPYSWTVGSTLSKWYVLMRDNGEIWGNVCPECGTVYVPPKTKCISCYKDMNDWVKLPGTGTVETFTVVNYEEPALQPKSPPIIYGVVKMDGADTGIVHLIDEIEPEKVMVGMRVEAVMADERTAAITDIKYFKPVA
jgi:uncharacterized OB-fold protein